ncbi:hypothetical protein ACUIG8_28635 [Raoultella ornithinolytica]|uniref:hypothetical protein n=1 Tax=Raoultella ornithinolytica TaxID=54291 RepID=UPI00403DEDE2
MTVDKASKENQEYNDSFDAIGRELPPAFPLSIRFGIAEDICIIDFIDLPSKNTRKVFYSVAITKDHAKKLISGLKKFVDAE